MELSKSLFPEVTRKEGRIFRKCVKNYAWPSTWSISHQEETYVKLGMNYFICFD